MKWQLVLLTLDQFAYCEKYAVNEVIMHSAGRLVSFFFPLFFPLCVRVAFVHVSDQLVVMQ